MARAFPVIIIPIPAIIVFWEAFVGRYPIPFYVATTWIIKWATPKRVSIFVSISRLSKLRIRIIWTFIIFVMIVVIVRCGFFVFPTRQ